MAFILYKEESKYAGHEISYCCTTSVHRDKGVMTHMLRHVLEILSMDGEDIYLEAWHLGNEEKVNIHTPITECGMEFLMKDVSACRHPYFKECKTCPCRDGDACFCWCDLYRYRADNI